jgi:hypothetical protein
LSPTKYDNWGMNICIFYGLVVASLHGLGYADVMNGRLRQMHMRALGPATYIKVIGNDTVCVQLIKLYLYQCFYFYLC